MYILGHLNDLIYVYIFLYISVTPGKAKRFLPLCLLEEPVSLRGLATYSNCSPPNQWLLVNQEFHLNIERIT